MRPNRSFGLPALCLSCSLSLALACDTGDDDPGPSDGGSDAASADAGERPALLQAPAAQQVGTLQLDEPVTNVEYLEDLALSLHEQSGVSILDLSDPTKPRVISKLPTTGKPVAVALDAALRIVFIVTASGDLRAYRVADVRGPIQVAQTTLSESGAAASSFRGMVRVHSRLYVLGASSLLPVFVATGSSSGVGFTPEAAVPVDAGAQHLASGGSSLYVAFAGGDLQVWSAGIAPRRLTTVSLGADVLRLIVRGRRVLAALAGVGVRVLDLTDPGSPKIDFDAPELAEVQSLVRYGNLVIAALRQGLLVALDISDFSAPRALVTREGALPSWIAPVGGNLLLGGGKQLSVFGVPPFVSASVPRTSLSAFPRYGRIPLQLSKAVDPATVTIDSVRLRCGGTTISGKVSISPDARRITFLPDSPLPAGASCSVSLRGVADALGLPLGGGSSLMSITTATEAPAAVENPKSAYAHTADGAFTDWTSGATDGFEYFDVAGAKGMYSYFYADYDGEKLWLLNDWFYNGDDIDPDCYNQFGVWTGGGAQRWEIRAYGDQRIEVRLNGTLLSADDPRVTGGYSRSATRNVAEPHTVYEIAIETAPGTWGVQLHDPGPTFSCHELESDPTNYNGASMMTGSVVDPTQAPAMPEKPVAQSGGTTSSTPTLTWTVEDPQRGAFDAYLFELSTGDNLDNVFYRTVVYGQSLVLPAGLLQGGMTYTFRVTAYNLAGSVAGDPVTFTVGGQAAVAAPTLGSVAPSSVVEDTAQALTLTGQGFVAGARAYWDGVAVGTTFVSATELTAMLEATDTASPGDHSLQVRNQPDDPQSASEALTVVVTPAQSQGVTLAGLDPDTGTAGVYRNVTVSLTNGISSLYYLVLTPSGGGQATSVFCDWTGGDQCSASVILGTAGAYDAKVQVGDGQGQYDTNTLAGAFTVSAQAALTTLDPEVGTAGTDTPVTVNMTGGSANASYQLVLTPSGGGAETVVACSYNAQAGTCSATVPGSLPQGSYSAKLRVTAGGQPYDSQAVGSAFLQNAGAVICLTGGATLGPSGSGTCAAPWVIDPSVMPGSVFVHTVGEFMGANATDGELVASTNVCLAGTVRDLIYSVSLGSMNNMLRVSLDGGNADNIVAIFPGGSCDGIAYVCNNLQGSGVCEYAVKDGGFSSAQALVVVSETDWSYQDLQVRFQVN